MPRGEALGVGGISVPVPSFFPAISSVKSNMRTLQCLQVVQAGGFPQFLVSAHDIYCAEPRDRRAMERVLRDAVKARQIVLLDSGNYEAFWRERTKWWSPARLAQVLRTAPCHLAFAFDELDPKGNESHIARSVERAVVRDQRSAGQATVVPIVHGQRGSIPAISAEAAKRLNPILVAVPERELGDGLLDRAQTVAKIRRRLDRLGYYCGLHLLGTGNPISILVYSLCGADTFDGLEWCRTVVDYETARLHHFTHWDLFANQSGVDMRRLPYQARVLVHNLGFYAQWLDRIRSAIRAGKGLRLLEEHLPGKADQLAKCLGLQGSSR
jgi:queuine/archaeosine tRNA-ribosyltransferase